MTLMMFVCLFFQETPSLHKNVQGYETMVDLSFTEDERTLMEGELKELLAAYQSLHQWSLGNDIPPALVFQLSKPPPEGPSLSHWYYPPIPPRPEDLNELAFASVAELSALIRHRVISCSELTELSLKRLKQLGPKLSCVISLTETRARETAAARDRELDEGIYRGPLHGIPYGAKDLLATAGDLTTWGARPFEHQRTESDARVVTLLEEAGAILVAKLSLGALAWGDVWFGGTTKNPWNLEQGSSGSSAGSAAATAAGLVPFAIGSETYGSIVSPSTRCGVTGFRPTFGAVSRHGAMALSWSMDKLGPIARTVQDCAMVFDAIRGVDPLDPATTQFPFNFDAATHLKSRKIGFVRGQFPEPSPVLDQLVSLGAELVPVELPEFPVSSLSLILTAEAAAAFDELTRSNNDDKLVRQIEQAWPNVFRAARTIPAVEYIQANRHRVALARQMDPIFQQIDVLVAPPFEGSTLLLTNLTGHPTVVLPSGSYDGTRIPSVTFIGDIYGDDEVLEVAFAYQHSTSWHLSHPPDFK
ncbi:MAG: amidase [Acidobacteria bacterium]|nr:amidase [Acidobacteriota bacterium]